MPLPGIIPNVAQFSPSGPSGMFLEGTTSGTSDIADFSAIGPESGDLLVLANFASSLFGPPGAYTPTGWTQIDSLEWAGGFGDYRGSVWMKKSNGTETTVDLFEEVAFQSCHAHTGACFRPNRFSWSTWTQYSWSHYGTNTNIGNRTIPFASASVFPAIAIGIFFSSSDSITLASYYNLEPTVSRLDDGTNRMLHQINNTGPSANCSYDPNEGGYDAVIHGYITLS